MNLTARLKSRDYICRKYLPFPTVSYHSFRLLQISRTLTSERDIGSYLPFVFVESPAPELAGD
jgi:hypothetical protein